VRRGLDLSQEGEETERERKRGTGAATLILTGSAAWSRGGVARGGTTWRGGGGEAWGSLLTDERRPAGSGSRPAGTGGVVRPCCAASSTGVREGADRRARAHSGERLCRLAGGPGCTVSGGVVQTRIEIKSEFKWFETFLNCCKL
jgi:hypothetical protein